MNDLKTIQKEYNNYLEKGDYQKALEWAIKETEYYQSIDPLLSENKISIDMINDVINKRYTTR